MTKPFESIRQLFGRVLGGKSADEGASGYSTLGITSAEASAANGDGHAAGFAVENSQPEIEVQTADTQRLPQVAPELLNGRNGKADHHPIAPEEGADEFGDALLDLGDVHGGKAFAGDDPFLDVLDEDTPQEEVFVKVIPEAPAMLEDSSDRVVTVSDYAENQNWSSPAEYVAVEVAKPDGETEKTGSVPSPTNFSDLSPEAIDAIARRVVAQLSDKVVQEIAWEVVPEMAELMIKQKLEAK